jgi:hypothetical protein
MKRYLTLLASLFVVIGCAETSGGKAFLVPVPPPKAKSEEKIADLNGVAFSPKVDILFIVDDSGSMSSHQANLSANIGLFISELAKDQILDYHIGVITSDMSDARKSGRLQGFPSVVDKTTPGGLTTLQNTLIVGTYGSATEQLFMPVIAALTPPLVDGPNLGFYRPDAHLALIYITDTEDQSPVSVDYFLNFLERLKQGDKDKVLAYGVIVPAGARNCPRDDAPKNRLELALTELKAINFSLCDPDYGFKLAGLGANLAERVSSFIPLNQIPDVNTIRVTYGNQVIPNDTEKGWAYIPDRVGLKLGRGLILSEQPEGTQLQVDFVPADNPLNKKSKKK